MRTAYDHIEASNGITILTYNSGYKIVLSKPDDNFGQVLTVWEKEIFFEAKANIRYAFNGDYGGGNHKGYPPESAEELSDAMHFIISRFFSIQIEEINK
jgi:hypothetical protein